MRVPFKLELGNAIIRELNSRDRRSHTSSHPRARNGAAAMIGWGKRCRELVSTIGSGFRWLVVEVECSGCRYIVLYFQGL